MQPEHIPEPVWYTPENIHGPFPSLSTAHQSLDSLASCSEVSGTCWQCLPLVFTLAPRTLFPPHQSPCPFSFMMLVFCHATTWIIVLQWKYSSLNHSPVQNSICGLFICRIKIEIPWLQWRLFWNWCHPSFYLPPTTETAFLPHHSECLPSRRALFSISCLWKHGCCAENKDAQPIFFLTATKV